jgi:phosphate transport system permease protein
MSESNPSDVAGGGFAIQKRRVRLLGLTIDDCIKAFFGGNAIVSIVVLALITYFLFREGAGFFGQNRQNLEVYRQAGLEYVDHMGRQIEDHTALTHYLSDVRLAAMNHLAEARQVSAAEANGALATFDQFSGRFSAMVEPLRGLESDLRKTSSAIKTKAIVNEDKREERRQLLAEGKKEQAEQVRVVTLDFATELRPVVGSLPVYKELNREFAAQLTALLRQLPALPTPELQQRMARWQQLASDYLATFPAVERNLEQWDHRRPVPASQALSAFIFGRKWLTASFWQDWYGIVPLFVGSLMVAIVALLLAVPLGVGAAIYVNQFASAREQKVIKPCIEFISAFPSVVLGFFGIAVLGQALRLLSQQEWLSWIPGFPYSERLNILTAGCLLALIAVPTIFTLAEDALNNVPTALKEASFALGASRLQTTLKIIVPASLSGIISAVLLGLGRVIGETMVVLLCAGNRIAIPDFSRGLAVITEPVHTMTGIIAQEMGEVVRGSIHYRALFVVGLVLFVLSLLINYLAQRIVRRYRISIG